MTLEAATEAAKREAELFGLSFSVYRFVAWQEGVWGARMTTKIPKEAVIAVTFEPEKPTEASPLVEPITTEDDGQGSLF